jgi:hypothetical protein
MLQRIAVLVIVVALVVLTIMAWDCGRGPVMGGIGPLIAPIAAAAAGQFGPVLPNPIGPPVTPQMARATGLPAVGFVGPGAPPGAASVMTPVSTQLMEGVPQMASPSWQDWAMPPVEVPSAPEQMPKLVSVPVRVPQMPLRAPPQQPAAAAPQQAQFGVVPPLIPIPSTAPALAPSMQPFTPAPSQAPPAAPGLQFGSVLGSVALGALGLGAAALGLQPAAAQPPAAAAVVAAAPADDDDLPLKRFMRPSRPAAVYIVGKGVSASSSDDTSQVRLIAAGDEKSLDAALAKDQGRGETYGLSLDGPGDLADLVVAAGALLNLSLPAQYASPDAGAPPDVRGRLYQQVRLDKNTNYKRFVAYIQPPQHSPA